MGIVWDNFLTCSFIHKGLVLKDLNQTQVFNINIIFYTNSLPETITEINNKQKQGRDKSPRQREMQHFQVSSEKRQEMNKMYKKGRLLKQGLFM